MTYEEARDFLMDQELRNDGAFSDTRASDGDEIWDRFGKHLWAAIDRVIAEAERHQQKDS